MPERFSDMPFSDWVIKCPWCGSPDWETRRRGDVGAHFCNECGEAADAETQEALWERVYEYSLPDMTGYAEQ